MKFLKSLLTTFLTFYLTISPVKSQEQKPKEIEINKKKYSLLEDKVTTEDNLVIRDKEILSKVIKTSQIQDYIDSLQLNPAALKALELYAKGQELTIKYNEHIDWLLRLPFKILARIITEQPVTLEDLEKEFKDITQKQLKETAQDIAKDPEKHLKHLAYEYFAQANEKAKFNLTILKSKPILDYETASKFENNSSFVEIFLKPSQELYYNTENLRKLEERWMQTFLQEVEKTLPGDSNKTKLTDFVLKKYEEIVKDRLEELQPYKQFLDSIAAKKEECEKSRKEREKDLEEKIKSIIKKIKLDNNVIVYTSNLTGNFEIYSMDKEGKNKIQLTNNGYRDICPKWTSDGKIIFCSKIKDNHDIYIMDQTGTNIQQLTNTLENETNPIMLSNGDIIFVSDKNGNDEIYIKEKSGKIKQLTNTKENELEIDISPDEKWLCFERELEKGYDKEKEGIFILNLGSMLERKLDDHGHNPRFCPNGKIGYCQRYNILIKDIYGTMYKEISHEQIIPKDPNTRDALSYLLGWVNNDIIIIRCDRINELIKLPENRLIKNIYTFNLKTNEFKQLTHTDNKVWNDHADCLKK